jgi:hypothetical protein
MRIKTIILLVPPPTTMKLQENNPKKCCKSTLVDCIFRHLKSLTLQLPMALACWTLHSLEYKILQSNIALQPKHGAVDNIFFRTRLLQSLGARPELTPAEAMASI